MTPSKTDRIESPLRLVAGPLAGALLAAAGLAQEPSFDPTALDHSYADLDVHPALDHRALDELTNSPGRNAITDAGAQLGRVLFYDKRLSRNQKTACASCHVQEHAFADPRPLSRGFQGRKTGRNSMGLVNLAYYSNGRFFWDERGTSLEAMVLMPIQDEIEMGMTLEEVVARLADDAGYRWLFHRAFGDSQVTVDRLGFGLAQFLRSMVSFDSKFDEGLALAGSVEKDFPNFSAEENHGKRLFFGIGAAQNAVSCASCHVREPELDPERFASRAHHPRPRPVLFQGAEASNNGVDRGVERDDPGLARTTSVVADKGRFKVPSLRNVELTAPYMHDGRFANLSSVIDHYSSNIQLHPNLDERLGRPGGGWGGGDIGRPTTPPSTPPSRPPVGLTPVPRAPVTHGPPTPGTPPVQRGRRLVETTGPVFSSSVTATVPGPAGLVTARPSSGKTGFDFQTKEKKALIAFLKTLTDNSFVSDPKYSDPFR